MPLDMRGVCFVRLDVPSSLICWSFFRFTFLIFVIMLLPHPLHRDLDMGGMDAVSWVVFTISGGWLISLSAYGP